MDDNCGEWLECMGVASGCGDVCSCPYVCKVQSMDDNCGEWVECMGVASGCGEQEAGVDSGSRWKIWVWLLRVVVRMYIDFLILPIPTPLFFFTAAFLLFVHCKKCFSFLFQYFFVIKFYLLKKNSHAV